MNAYEQKQEQKRLRLLDAADRAEERSAEAYKKADLREEASGIPLGQPILVGHHSEGRHRAAIARADAAMKASIWNSKRAMELRDRAESVGKGGISSDDPEAIAKLKDKVADLEKTQQTMREANRIVRKWVKKGVTCETQGAEFEAYAKDLAEIGDQFDSKNARDLISPQWGNAGPIGFAPFQLTNNNAKIKAAKRRIAQLEKASQRETLEVQKIGYKIVQNAEANRLQFIFAEKPSADIRQAMKKYGFRWAPSQNAWQRQLNNRALYFGDMVADVIDRIGV